MFPTGTVTFLFTDIEESTQHWEREPEQMKAALARHDALLHTRVTQGNGQIVKTTGDGVHAVFGTTVDALAVALDAQRALLTEAWPTTVPLRVRMSLHTGEAEWRDGDYHGSAVNRAARLMSIAAGGQILLSLATAELVRDRLPADVALVDLGRHRLRGLTRPEQVYQLNHPDLPADLPLLRTAAQTPNNLPEELTSFIGREQVVEQLARRLTPSGESAATTRQARLITLIGPGGTGKTRLSLHLARQLLDHFPDGVWLVELAPVADPALVVQTIASPLGLKELPGRPLLQRVSDRLRKERHLLILDNCEHLIDECARVAVQLLRGCPHLTILASSREALGVSGESVFRVRSLQIPPAELDPDLPELSAFEAVRLFVERARLVRADFALTAENAQDVAQISRRLDGIPLAIELAASRVRALAPAQIAARLDDRFRLLTGGSRTALPRQRTLQALIDWSYDLLSEQEQIMLQRLSVFSGGWTLASAEAVAGFDPIEPLEVFDFLDQLVNKSMIIADQVEWGARYRILETIRQYAQGKLAESGTAAAVRDRHLAYFVDLTQEVSEAVIALRPHNFAEQLPAESENLRAARAWALEHDLWSALRLISGQVVRFGQTVPVAEAWRYAEAVAELARHDPAFSGPQSTAEGRRLLGQALATASNLAFVLGYNPKAVDYSQQAITIGRAEGDISTLAWAYGISGSARGMLGDLTGAMADQLQTRELARQAGNRYQLALNLVSFAHYYETVGDPTQLASAAEVAWSDWEEGCAMFQEAGDSWGLAFAHMMAAGVARHSGDLDQAVEHASRALELTVALGGDHQQGRPLTTLADVGRIRGEWDVAVDNYLQALRAWHEFGQFGGAARCLECLAFVARGMSDSLSGVKRSTALASGAALLGAADALRREHNVPMNVIEQREHTQELTALQEALGEKATQEAWDRGQRLSLEEAIDRASSQLEPLVKNAAASE